MKPSFLPQIGVNYRGTGLYRFTSEMLNSGIKTSSVLGSKIHPLKPSFHKNQNIKN